MTDAFSHSFARDWIAAWNRGDLEAVLSHYADEIEFTSPFVAQLSGQSSGTLRGKAALRDYFANSLKKFPELRFELREVFTGINSITLLYRGVNDLLTAEAIEFNALNQIVRVQCHYIPASSREPARTEKNSVHEWTQGDYVLTDDANRLDLDAICALLHGTYWANDRPREVIEKGLHNSVCLGLFHEGRQVGLARAVTDHATFTWVCDVIVHSAHRGHGLGKWMMERLLQHPELQTISHHLCTQDAHALYEQFGFKRIEAMRRSDRPMPFLEL